VHGRTNAAGAGMRRSGDVHGRTNAAGRRDAQERRRAWTH
jgi:hypothetical protein